MNIPITVKGRYHFKAVNSKNEVREFPEVCNVITDIGFNRLLANSVFDNYCLVGKGVSAVFLPTQTNLELPLASTTTVQTAKKYANRSKLPFVNTSYTTYRFPVGSITTSITEVGVGWGVTNSLFSRTLIKDLNGNPTSITLLPDEYLDVTYFLDILVPSQDIVSTVNINGIDHTVTVRAAKASNPNKWVVFYPLFTNTGSYAISTDITTDLELYPTGTTISNPTVLTMKPYVAGSKKTDIIMYFDANAGVFTGGIKSLLLDSNLTNNISCFQIGFNPPIMKTLEQTLSFKFTLSFSNGG